MSVILHIITGLNDGGAEAVLYRVCVRDRNNTHVVISMMDEGKYGPLLRKFGINLYCLNAVRGRISLRMIQRLWKIIRDVRPDVVQTWMYHANLVGGVVAYVAGVKRIFWSIRHASLSQDDSKLTTRITDRLSALLSRVIPYKIIAIGNKVAEVHLSKGYAAKFILIHNGCDTGVFFPSTTGIAELMREFGLKAELPIIGCVARWTPEKDHATFLRAIALVSRACKMQVILVGTGCVPENEELSALISCLKIEDMVSLIGPRCDIPNIMNLLDIHVLPSKNEAFGNVIIESMATGTPCISTNVGDALHIIGQTGWVVPPQDCEVMAKYIMLAISERGDRRGWEKRRSLSRSRVINNFSIEKMVHEYDLAWNTLS